MTDIGVLQFVHVMGLVYWLGADLGVFYSSYYVADDQLSPEARLTVAKILFWLDQAPRIAMPIMLGSGFHLAWRFGTLPLPEISVYLSWAVVGVWLALVFLLHARGPSALLSRIDFGLRILIVVLTAGIASWALATNALVYWVAWKLLVFAGLVSCGLMIRIRLKPFAAAFAALARGTPGSGDNQTIREVFASTRPFVVAIWIGLIVNTLLGLHLL